MRIWLLSELVDSPGNEIFIDAARVEGHQVALVRPNSIDLDLAVQHPESMSLRVSGSEMLQPDWVFTRLGSTSSVASLHAVRQLERFGVKVINSSQSIFLARSKLRTFQVLAEEGLPLPRTIRIWRDSGFGQIVKELGDPPWIVKIPEGSQGIGVMRVDSLESLAGCVETLWGLGQEVLVQQFLSSARGRDLRVFVVGDSVCAAMLRTASPGEFRSNLHRGGSAQAIEIAPKIEQVCIRAAQSLGLSVAGVDLLPAGGDSWMITEVNASPGIAGIQEASGVDVTGRILALFAR